MEKVRIHKGRPGYPFALMKYRPETAPETIAAIGNLNILQSKTLAIFVSVKCPGKIILDTYDYLKSLKDHDMTFIGGFHSPMEQECLDILLKGAANVILCPARSIEGMRIKNEYKHPIENGKLLILSAFSQNHNRISSKRSFIRNDFVATLADQIFIPYAADGSKTETLCREWLEKGKSVFTFNSNHNKNLIKIGCKTIEG